MKLPQQFLVFLGVGGTAAAVNVASRVAFSSVMSYAASIVAAYCVGMTVAFLLNRTLVFTGATNAVRSQVGWFVLINLFGATETLLVSLVTDRYVLAGLIMTSARRELISHIIGVLAPVVTSYFGHKHITFRCGGHDTEWAQNSIRPGNVRGQGTTFCNGPFGVKSRE